MPVTSFDYITKDSQYEYRDSYDLYLSEEEIISIITARLNQEKEKLAQLNKELKEL